MKGILKKKGEYGGAVYSGGGSRGKSSKESKAKSLIGKTIEVKNRRFKVKEILGEGGYSNVYRVVEDGTNNVYALKRMLLSADEIDLVKREVSLMKSIPPQRNLVRFECANVTTSAEKRKGEDLMEANIIMEYADVRLFDVMEARHTEGKYFSEAELITIMADVCEGVSVLHQHRPPIAHRDIKVENVLLGSDGAYKLCDFGSATSVVHHPKTQAEREVAESDIERNTTMVYRAPEMLDLYAAKPIDEKADIWALGCMLYKMCFFEDAFSIGGRLAILKASYTFPESPKYSPEIYDLIKYMLELEAEARPSILWVIRRLHKIKKKLGLVDEESASRHKRSHTWGGAPEVIIQTSAASPSSQSLRASETPGQRERRKASHPMERKGSDASDHPRPATPPAQGEGLPVPPRAEARSVQRRSFPRRELKFGDGSTSGQDTNGVDGPLARPTSAFAFPGPNHAGRPSMGAIPMGSPLFPTDTSATGSPVAMLAPSQGQGSGSPNLLSGSPLMSLLPHQQQPQHNGTPTGLSIMPLGSGGMLTSHPANGGLTITPLASGGLMALPHGLGGLSMVPLHSGGNQVPAVHPMGLSITPLASGGPQPGLTITPVQSGGAGGLSITPHTSGGNQNATGLTITPLTSGGAAIPAIPYPTQQIGNNVFATPSNHSQASGEIAAVPAAMGIMPIPSGGHPTGSTTPPRALKMSANASRTGISNSGSAASGPKETNNKDSRGEVITFETMMQLIEKEKEEEQVKKTLDGIPEVREEGKEKGYRKPGSSKKKKKRREMMSSVAISSSDEDGINMLASSEHDLSEPKLKRKLKKSDKGKEKAFKEIGVKETLGESAGKEPKGNRKSKLFGKLAVEYAGESRLEGSGSFDAREDEGSSFAVINSPPLPLSMSLTSTSKESKQAQFINSDIPLHEPFVKHNFDFEFVFGAEYLAREAVAKGIKIWGLKSAETAIDDLKLWQNLNVTDNFFAHIKSYNLTNNYEECTRCLLAMLQMLRKGSPCILAESYQHIPWLQNLRSSLKAKEKSNLQQLLCIYLERKLQFHYSYPHFEGTYSLQTYHAQKRLKSDHFALDQAHSFQELDDLLGVLQSLVDIPNLILSQLESWEGYVLDLLPTLITESHGILSIATYLLVKLKVFSMDKDKIGTFHDLKASYKALYSILSRSYSQTLQFTTIPSHLVPMLPQRQKISASLNVQALQYPVSYNPHFCQLRVRTLSREMVMDKEREKKERKEREKRERDEKKREKERSKMEKKREREMKKGLKPSKKVGKDLKKDLKREMQKEWEEELERERGRDKGRGNEPVMPEPVRRIASSSTNDQNEDVTNTVDEAKQVELRARLDKLLQLPENKVCAECGASGPRWASVNLGIFMCLGCSGLHRGLGTHISKVKSCTLDLWSQSQVDFMELMGNKKASDIWEARVPPTYQRPNELSSKEMIKRWIEDKYVYRRFREELHPSVKGVSPRHAMPSNNFAAAPQLELVNEHGRTASLMEVPSLGAVADNRSPLRRTHSRSKSYAGHEKTVNEFDVSRMINQQKAIYDSSWNPFS